jgi:hypothetical protein
MRAASRTNRVQWRFSGRISRFSPLTHLLGQADSHTAGLVAREDLDGQ